MLLSSRRPRQGRASQIRLKGIFAVQRKRLKPLGLQYPGACRMTRRSLPVGHWPDRVGLWLHDGCVLRCTHSWDVPVPRWLVVVSLSVPAPHRKSQIRHIRSISVAESAFIEEVERTGIVIVSILMAIPDDGLILYSAFADWIMAVHERGALLCSACTGLLVPALRHRKQGERRLVRLRTTPTWPP